MLTPILTYKSESWKILKKIAGVTKLDRIIKKQLRWFSYFVRMKDERTIKTIWKTEAGVKRRYTLRKK